MIDFAEVNNAKHSDKKTAYLLTYLLTYLLPHSLTYLSMVQDIF